MLPTAIPLAVYFDLSGEVLTGGYIFFGLPNENPETSPVTVYWDAAGTQPAAQPIRTVNGYIVRNGQASNVFIDVEYSITVKDSNQRLIRYAGTSEDFDAPGTMYREFREFVDVTFPAFVDELASADGAAMIGYQNTSLDGSVVGTLADRIYDINAVADFGADPTGLTDSTEALKAFFLAMFDGCYAVIPPGLYLYTPILAVSTGEGYLNMENLTRANLFGYGATIKNSFAVTIAPATQGTLYGVHILSCVDSCVHGLKFDGNRDITFGTNSDGNEFYSGFYITGSTRSGVKDVEGVNCQGDGISTNRITGNTGFNTDCFISGACHFGGNRRNEISVGGDYGLTIDGGISLVGSSDAHRTNPKAGIDLEWEHATIGPVGNNQRLYVGAVTCSGAMAGGGIYIPRGAGITVGPGFRTRGLTGASINIDNTATGYYETQSINIVGCQLDSVYGIGITGGANISIKDVQIKASYPITVNSPLSAAPYQWVADIDGCTILGESVFAVNVIDGRTKFSNNMCINCSGGGGDTYMAFFKPLCHVSGNTFTRDSNQPAPGYGMIFATGTSVVLGNKIVSSSIAHVISYGQTSTPVYPAMQENFYNGNMLPDTVDAITIPSNVVDSNIADPQILYTPYFRYNTEITSMLRTIAVEGISDASTTGYGMGTASSAYAYMAPQTMTGWALGDVTDVVGDMVLTNGGVNTSYAEPVFVTFIPGNNKPKIQFMITLRTNRTNLYTSATTFG